MPHHENECQQNVNDCWSCIMGNLGGDRFIGKKHFRPGGMALSEWTRSVRDIRDTLVAEYSAPGLNTMRRVAHRHPIVVSPFLPQTLQEHSQMLLKAPAVMEVHSGRYEI